ncbi:MAG: hypothetical protein ACPG7F_08900 [Aggregatilineales bacterium]
MSGTYWRKHISESSLCPLTDEDNDESDGQMFRDTLPEHNTT